MCSEARGLRCCVEEHEYFSRFQDTTDVLSGHPDPVFPGLSPLWFLSVFWSEAAVEGEVGSGRRRCWGLFRGRDFWHASVNVVWAPWSRGLKGWLSVCMLRGATLKKKMDQARNPYKCPDLHVKKLFGVTLVHMHCTFTSRNFPQHSAEYILRVASVCGQSKLSAVAKRE